MTDPSRLAVLADVHGNRWALEAVLADLRDRGVDAVFDLGDSVYGPLDPRGTARLLREIDPPSVRGNQDRIVLDPPDEVAASATWRHVRRALTTGDLAWLERHSPEPLRRHGLFLCHGTPDRDDAYLAEDVGEYGVSVRSPDELAERLSAVDDEVVLCAHSHVPRVLAVPPGTTLVNPGSVGLPAYIHDDPRPHSMEAGSPHARYAILDRRPDGWSVEIVSVPYDWECAARSAERHGRPDWAEWLRLGRTRPSTGGMDRRREERVGAALRWIASRLDELGVPFQVAGGLAALAHGADRPLNDIDLYVPEGGLERIREAEEVAEHHTHGPRRYRSERWDCYFMELRYAGEEIAVAEAPRTRYRRGAGHPWHEADVDFDGAEMREVFGTDLPVMPADRLIAYKRGLGRPVDRRDVARLTESGATGAT